MFVFFLQLESYREHIKEEFYYSNACFNQFSVRLPLGFPFQCIPDCYMPLSLLFRLENEKAQ